MSEWDDDSYAFSENVLSVKLNGILVRMLVDSGAQSTVLGEKKFEFLEQRGLRAELVPDNRNLRVYVYQFPKVFSGIGKLSGYQLSLNIDPTITPVAQKPRKIPFSLKDKVIKKTDELGQPRG